MNILKQTRLTHNISQIEACKILGVSRRTYQRYEGVENDNAKLEAFSAAINNRFIVDEEHGVLSIASIRELVKPVLEELNISICILFGSYAKGKASDISDVDLLVDYNYSGIDYFAAVEKFREALHKKVDLITTSQLISSKEFMETILKEGIRLND